MNAAGYTACRHDGGHKGHSHGCRRARGTNACRLFRSRSRSRQLDGQAISSHHPWMRVADCSTNTRAHSRRRSAPLKRNSRSRHTFSPRDGKRGGYYFLSYAALAVYIPPSYEFSIRSRVLMRV
ncbi:hypothetical protein EVAR_56266_1 [Eumeta japonica]|uniref:Uncharacterized protein n=1 Tax=Eumeta variegata TaxID=151549 RepID=A0A4C1YKV3_EUMVA|nr:hypothetical protein EVAR_56266_1 [Eumeta japonica]